MIDVLQVAGVPQTALTIGMRNVLPSSAPPAPWVCRANAVLWTSVAGPAAQRAVGFDVPGPALTVVGGVVEYLDTPVGPYNEVLGAVGLMTARGPRASVPFMAVDLPASIVGGRANWALPKTFAAFRGSPTSGPVTASGEKWTVHASARSGGPAVPLRTRGTLLQKWPDGVVRSATIRVSGRMQPAVVRVRVDADRSLSGWFRSGWHLGVRLTDLTFTLGGAR